MLRDEYREILLEKNDKRAVAWIDGLRDAEWLSCVSLDDPLTKDQYVKLFSAMALRHYRVFLNNMSYTQRYLKFLIEHRALPQEQLKIVASVSYFDISLTGDAVLFYRSVEMLKEHMDRAMEGTSRVSAESYLVPRTIAYFTWYGIPIAQSVNIRKDDLQGNGFWADGVYYPVPKDVAQDLYALKNSDGYMVRTKGVRFREYVDSEYMLRSFNYPQLTQNRAFSFLSRMNDLDSGLHAFTYDTIRQSGIFYRAYIRECNEGPLDLEDRKLISEVFCEEIKTRQQQVRITMEYRKFKQFFNQIGS